MDCSPVGSPILIIKKGSDMRVKQTKVYEAEH